MVANLGDIARREAYRGINTTTDTGLHISDGLVTPNGEPINSVMGRREFIKRIVYGGTVASLGATAGLSGGGCASIPQASLYNLEEALLSGRIVLPSDEQFKVERAGNHYVITDKDGNSVIGTKPKAYYERIVDNFKQIGRGLFNFLRDIADGSEFMYADGNRQIRKAQNVGLLHSGYKAAQNLASAFTIGFYDPDGQNPTGGVERILHIPKKLYEAIIGNIVTGIPKSIGNMLNNLISSGVYTVQMLPTIVVGYSDDASKKVHDLLTYINSGVRTLSNAIPLIGAGWQRTAEIDFYGIPIPVVNYAFRDRKPSDYVEPTTFRKLVEIPTALGLTYLGVVIGKNAARESKRKQPQPQQQPEAPAPTPPPLPPPPPVIPPPPLGCPPFCG